MGVGEDLKHTVYDGREDPKEKYNGADSIHGRPPLEK
jgi:hypothetical protein